MLRRFARQPEWAPEFAPPYASPVYTPGAARVHAEPYAHAKVRRHLCTYTLTFAVKTRSHTAYVHSGLCGPGPARKTFP